MINVLQLMASICGSNDLFLEWIKTPMDEEGTPLHKIELIKTKYNPKAGKSKCKQVKDLHKEVGLSVRMINKIIKGIK